MRAMTSSILMIAVMLAAMPAQAQTYDPAYPVCLQVNDNMGSYISCRYVSMEQCRMSASGRAAQCLVNPYFAGAPRNARAYRRLQ
jgi:Protein of unknown function (DUF3551)